VRLCQELVDVASRRREWHHDRSKCNTSQKALLLRIAASATQCSSSEGPLGSGKCL
jgi:hypothetical protein